MFISGDSLFIFALIAVIVVFIVYMVRGDCKVLEGDIYRFNEHFLRAHLTLSEKGFEGIGSAITDLKICLHEGYFGDDLRLAVMFLREAIGYHREILEDPAGSRETFYFFSRQMSFLDALGALEAANKKLRERNLELGWILDPENDDISE
jgi:hypothetical protein